MILASILLKTALWAVFFSVGSRVWLHRLLNIPKRPQTVGFIAWILAGMITGLVAFAWIWPDLITLSARR